MNLYDVQAIRWYFSEVSYRVVANDEDDAIQRARDGELGAGVIEYQPTSPTWNGDEEYQESLIIETPHAMNIDDDIAYDHISCQYLGSHRWNCGHIDLPDVEGKQLSLLDDYETSLGKPKSWNMWLEKWAESLNETALMEAQKLYEQDNGKEND